MAETGWLQFEGQDVQVDEHSGRVFAASSPAEISARKEQCLQLGYGGFLVQRGQASFRPQSREEILAEKGSRWGARTLYVAPPFSPSSSSTASLTVVHGNLTLKASPENLSARSGYFASLFRSSWADGGEMHAFQEFPGGEEAFAYAMSWLAADEGSSVGDPWPVHHCHHVCQIVRAAGYLDSPSLLIAATQSWRWAAKRPGNQLTCVAEALVEATLQFSGEDQERVIGEMKYVLQDLPEQNVSLATGFLAAPAAGLAVLEVDSKRRSGRSLYGHIKSGVRDLVGSVLSAGSAERADGPEDLSPHEFACQLFAAHELTFLSRRDSLRCLLRYLDPSIPVEPPLCFHLAAAAAGAEGPCEDEEVWEEDCSTGSLLPLAIDLFERGVAFAQDPAEAASHSSCVVGLFGAGSAEQKGALPLSLDVLARALVPPAAASVILSRVLSSWAIVGEKGATAPSADGADVILEGVAGDRQHLRKLLTTVLPRIASEDTAPGTSAEWGSSSDYAVPELRAALVSAAGVALATGEIDETLRLLFRTTFQPSGGLSGVRFPLMLLAEVKDHNAACAAMVAHRILEELSMLADEGAASNNPGVWAMAEELWPLASWESVDISLAESAVDLVKGWLVRAKASPDKASKSAAKEATIRLLRQLPLQKLENPEVLLGPPLPAQLLSCVALREVARVQARVEALEAENEALKQDIVSIRLERHKSN